MVPSLASVSFRIGIFAPYDLARPGGVNNQVRAQARALRRRGHHVAVCGAASAPLSDGEITLGSTLTMTVGGTESGLAIDPRSAARIGHFIRRERFDVLHVHEPLMPLLAWCVLWSARAPIVGTFHVHRENGHWLYGAARPWLARLVRRVSRRIAVSEEAKRTVSRYFPGDYEVVPNGIDLDTFRRSHTRPPTFAANRRHVLFVGRLEPRKGVEHLIRAMATVQNELPAARLLVIGDGPEREHLTTLARQLKVDAVFLADVGEGELPAYFQWADVACSPALGGESFGIVLLEAMACGTAIVASNIDGYASLIGDGGGARLVAPGDSEALARALTTVLKDDVARATLGQRGRVTAERFDWDRIASRLEAIYGRLCQV